MSARSRAAIRIWRARDARSSGDRAFLVYAIVLVAVVAVAPIARTIWLSASSAEGVATFASPAAPGVTMVAVAALWAGALLLGRDRGPASRPPFLTHALATSDLPLSDTFRGPVLRAGALVTAVTTLVSGLPGGVLFVHGVVDLIDVASFTTVGTLIGVITSVAWLGGQAFPRTAIPVALTLMALALVTTAVPALQQSSPWGWVGLTYPGTGSPSTLAALTGLTVALLSSVPVLMNRLETADLAAQAARWDSATGHATTMELSAVATIYQGRPQLGRRVRAVRPTGRLAWTFFTRDAIGTARTPGRLAVAVVAVATAGVLVTLALAPAGPCSLLGAAAGLVLYAGLRPITDGVRHAASVAADFPLYGISDEHLLANHVLFPLTVTVVVMLVVVTVCTIVTGIAATVPLLSALALTLIVLGTRIGGAMKGPLPPALLTPVPTPVGDLGAAVRLIWAVDGVLLAALAGSSVMLAFEAPILLICVAATTAGVGINRWRHR